MPRDAAQTMGRIAHELCKAESERLPVLIAGAAKWYLSTLLQSLAVLRDIEAFQLLLRRNADRNEQADQLEQDKGHDNRPAERDSHAVSLRQQEVKVAFKEAGGLADRGGGKHPRQEDAGHPADAMDAEHVQ